VFFVGSMWTLDVERLWWLKAVTDLHDILGHALEVVAFKSELASRLQAADPDRARAEMDEVQRVARESLREVRALVHDTRSIDIDVSDGQARLGVVNDGALPGDGADPGTGLVALGRYLDEHECRLDGGPGPGGTFRLDAVLPGAAR
jgi:two-component system sensor histidine kinase DesK